MEKINFRSGSYFNESIDNLIAPNLKIIIFSNFFNKQISISLPELEELYFGRDFDKRINRLIAPKLKKIIFGKNFNHQIEKSLHEL